MLGSIDYLMPGKNYMPTPNKGDDVVGRPIPTLLFGGNKLDIPLDRGYQGLKKQDPILTRGDYRMPQADYKAVANELLSKAMHLYVMLYEIGAKQQTAPIVIGPSASASAANYAARSSSK